MIHRELDVGVHNYFNIEILNSETLELVEKHVAYNIILDAFWSTYLYRQSQSAFSNIQYGEGVAEPLPSDLKLTIPIGGKPVTDIIKDYSQFETTGLLKRTSKIRIEASEANGKTISEVGLARDSSPGNYLTTKALLRDSNGNQIQILKTDTMVVDIYSTFFVKIPMKYITGDDPVKISNRLNGSFLDWLLGGAPLINQSSYAYPHKITYDSLLVMAPNVYDKTRKAGPTIGRANSIASRSMIYTISEISATHIWNDMIGINTIETESGLYVSVPNLEIPEVILNKEVIGVGDGTTKDFKCKFGGLKNNGTTHLYVNDVEVDATFDFDAPRPSVGSGIKVLRNTGLTISPGNLVIFENVMNTLYPMTQIELGNYTYSDFYMCDTIDGTYTKVIAGGIGLCNIPIQYQNYRYMYNSTNLVKCGLGPVYSNLKVIHALTAPSAGSTVSLTYTPDCLPKDTSNVIRNLAVTVSFAEYVPT